MVVYDADSDSFSSTMTRDDVEEQIQDKNVIEQMFPVSDVHTTVAFQLRFLTSESCCCGTENSRVVP